MRITIPAPLALYLADAMLAAVSTDPVTPIITSVCLAKEGKALRATATDRYRVHEVTLDAAKVAASKDEAINLPSSALRWLQRAMRIVAPRRANQVTATVTISSQTEGRFSIMILATGDVSSTYSDATVRGNFPPVGRLIDQAEQADRHTGDVRLNTTYLGKLTPLVSFMQGGAPVIKQTAPATGADTLRGKPGPVLVTATTEGVRARALIQPNLIVL